jgi:hypothetical protein
MTGIQQRDPPRQGSWRIDILVTSWGKLRAPKDVRVHPRPLRAGSVSTTASSKLRSTAGALAILGFQACGRLLEA